MPDHSTLGYDRLVVDIQGALLSPKNLQEPKKYLTQNNTTFATSLEALGKALGQTLGQTLGQPHRDVTNQARHLGLEIPVQLNFEKFVQILTHRAIRREEIVKGYLVYGLRLNTISVFQWRPLLSMKTCFRHGMLRLLQGRSRGLVSSYYGEIVRGHFTRSESRGLTLR